MQKFNFIDQLNDQIKTKTYTITNKDLEISDNDNTNNHIQDNINLNNNTNNNNNNNNDNNNNIENNDVIKSSDVDNLDTNINNKNTNTIDQKEILDDKPFLSILTLARSKDIKDNGTNCYTFIASSHYIYGDDMNQMNPKLIPDRIRESKLFNINYLNILIIHHSKEEFFRIQQISKFPNINLIFSSSFTFFNSGANSFDKLIDLYRIDLKNMVFIFRDLRWRQIQFLFRSINMIISGGATAKRHILSPTQFRLAQFLLLTIDPTSATISKSFHSEKAFEKDIPVNISEPFNVNDKLGVETSKKMKWRNDLDKKLFHTSAVRSKDDIKDLAINPVEMFSARTNSLNVYLEKVSEVINNPNKSNIEKQQLLEDQWVDFINIEHEDIDFIARKYSHGFINKITKAKESLYIFSRNGYLKSKFPILHVALNSVDNLIIAFAIGQYGVMSNLGYTHICRLVANAILYRIYVKILHKNKQLIRELEKFDSNSNLFDFLSKVDKAYGYDKFIVNLHLPQFSNEVLGNFFLDILSRFPSHIFEKSFDSPYNKNNPEVMKLKFNPELFTDIKENLIIDPASLPMLCTPNKWSDSSFGGYLNNKIQRDGVITGSTLHSHKVSNKEELYNVINNMSSIPFNYNNNMLNFIEGEGNFLHDVIYNNNSSESEKYQNFMFLKIANLYRNTPLFIPLQADWRGRIYTKSFFSNYQGGDLAISLLEFNEGKPLTEEGLSYLKIYGANLFNDNNTARATYEDREKWVDNNMENILNMHKDFILKAENIFCFTAFCLAMRDYKNNPQCEIKLPVFLDATCSGIQHLAALIKDENLAREVNLIDRSDSDKPADIYRALLKPINEEIRSIGETDFNYSKLALVNLDRKDVKHPILTRTYNVSQFGVSNQLIKGFKSNSNENPIVNIDNEKDAKRAFINVPSIVKGKTVPLNMVELNKISKIIFDSIFKEYPGLNLVYKYFIGMTKMLSSLNIPVSWLTPTGLELVQFYNKQKKVKLGISLGGKRSLMVLNEVLKEMDNGKQNSAIIPNVIHSLDASHLTNVVNRAFEYNNRQVITVHDCFGTHPNNMNSLFNLVKDEFIKLYINEDFIKRFHEKNIQSIRDFGFTIKHDNTRDQDFVIDNAGSVYYIPSIPDMGTLNLNRIKESKYIIT